MTNKFFSSCGLLVNQTVVSSFKLPRPEMRAPTVLSIPDTLIVKVEYGKKNPIVSALRRAHCVLKSKEFKLREVPAEGSGIKQCLVKEYHLVPLSSVHNALRTIVMKNSLCFADPLTVFEAVHASPRKHQFNELVTLFTAKQSRRLCHMIVRDSEGAREVEFGYVSVSHRYDRETRFLVIMPVYPKN